MDFDRIAGMHHDVPGTSSPTAGDPREPPPADISAYDIAWSLSQTNRFNGHALRPYSVAEHSLLVCDIAERELGLDAQGQFAALMHDAHEAYTGDLHTPGKHALGDSWYRWEREWQGRVRSAFDLQDACRRHADHIHTANLIALATEKRDLMPHVQAAWPLPDGIAPVPWVRLYSADRLHRTWEDWRDHFLDRFHALEAARRAPFPPSALGLGRPFVPRIVATLPPLLTHVQAARGNSARSR